MVSVCFYFQVHQPFRLRPDFSFFNIGDGSHAYEDEALNAQIVRKVADKCYLPMNRLLLELIRRMGGKFRVSFSISGVALEQFEMYAPEVIDSFRALVETGCVELLSETYYHSLAFLFSRSEFRAQVQAHKTKLKQLFGYEPTSFRNTELIYNNELAAELETMGYTAVLTEGAKQVLGWRTPNFVYQPAPCYRLKLLLKNFQLSDDLAFRFSDVNWEAYPLTCETYVRWVHKLAGNGEVLNLFMDYETFGEHQWADTGIFQFMARLPEAILAHPDFCFQTPTEVAESHQPMAKIDVSHFISWADIERDLTAWLGNPLQDASLEDVYAMEEQILATGDVALIHAWRKLQTSDHFYYMCTKWYSDGDVHKYFNPYDSPHQAHILHSNVLNDLREILAARTPQTV